MTLSAYMALRGFTDADMAKLIGQCTVSGLRKWRYGVRFPRGQTLIRIKEVTDGAVCPGDFVIRRKAAA